VALRKKISIKYLQDPGHGWFEVPHSMIIELCLRDQISTYSYMTHDKVFLEEDSDASKLLHALSSIGYTIPGFRVDSGVTPDPEKVVSVRPSYSDRDARCRTYARYNKECLGLFYAGSSFLAKLDVSIVKMRITGEVVGRGRRKDHYSVEVKYRYESVDPYEACFRFRKVLAPFFFHSKDTDDSTGQIADDGYVDKFCSVQV